MLPPSSAVGHVGRHPRPRGIVAGVEPRHDQRPGRLVDRDAGLELRPARDAPGSDPENPSVVALSSLTRTVSKPKLERPIDRRQGVPGQAAVVGGLQEDVGVVGRVGDGAGDPDAIDERGVDAALELAVGPQGVVRGEHEPGPDPLGRGRRRGRVSRR